ncbi:hypothetical protein ASD81_01745 [Nocardioides sp. Root614]|nr:hypothetical protein ASD81_01745 [Nocardioides sp. Root614]KRA93259.1 hypothetical protein ASD84_02010 [Nocardioides sp. Root682]
MRTDAKIVIAAFIGSGAVHLVKPEVFARTMPAWVPRHREVIIGSGVAELVCAAGMLHPRTRKVAGYASAALLAGVFPANVQMAVDAQKTDNAPFKAATLGRLPLQLPMIRGVLRAARSA